MAIFATETNAILSQVKKRISRLQTLLLAGIRYVCIVFRCETANRPQVVTLSVRGSAVSICGEDQLHLAVCRRYGLSGNIRFSARESEWI